MEIGTVLGMHDLECARHAFNGRHLSTFGLRQGGEARAPTMHAVKPFGPSINHCRSPFRHLRGASRIGAPVAATFESPSAYIGSAMQCRESRAIVVAMSSGWGVHVQVITREGKKSSQTYYARVPDRIGATEAVRRHVGAASDAVIEAHKPVQSSVFDVLNIDIGQVGQWV